MTKWTKEQIALFDELEVLSVAEQKAYAGKGIFDIYDNGNTVRIVAKARISKEAYNICRKLNGGEYLKEINFVCEWNLGVCFRLADIDRKYKKAKERELAGGKPRKAAVKKAVSKQSFQQWYDDADMPEKINGHWVDLETGLAYEG